MPTGHGAWSKVAETSDAWTWKSSLRIRMVWSDLLSSDHDRGDRPGVFAVATGFLDAKGAGGPAIPQQKD